MTLSSLTRTVAPIQSVSSNVSMNSVNPLDSSISNLARGLLSSTLSESGGVTFAPLQYSIIPSGSIALQRDVPEILLLELVQLLHDARSICRFLIYLPESVRVNIFRSHLAEALISSILRAARGNFVRVPNFIKKIFQDERIKNGIGALDLNNCPLESFSNTFHMLFQFFPNLKKLELENCHLTDEDLRKLINTPRDSSPLESLSLVANPNIRDIGSLVLRCYSLKHLDLGGCLFITNPSIENLTVCVRALTSLSLVGCGELTDASVQLLTEEYPNLRRLDLFGCTLMTDNAVRSIANGFRSLTYLNMGRCPAITDRELSGVSRLPSMEDLSLPHCTRITERAVEDLASNCKTLIRLNLFGCPVITERLITIINSHRFTDQFQSILKNSADFHCRKEAAEHDVIAIPTDAASFANLGEILREQGELARAKELFENAIALSPNDVFSLATLGRVLQEQGNLKKAKEHLERAFILAPRDLITLTNLGSVLLDYCDVDRAENLLLRAWTIAQVADARLLAYLGEAYRKKAYLSDAENTLESALEAQPSNACALTNMGIVLLEKEKFENARRHLEHAHAVVPNDVRTRIYFSIALRCLSIKAQDRRDDAGAKAFLKQARAIEPRRVLSDLQRAPVNTRESLEKALSLEPKNPSLLRELGIVYLHLNDLESAWGYLQQAHVIEPNNPLTLVNLGKILHRRHLINEAKGYFERTIAIESDNVAALTGMGAILTQHQNNYNYGRAHLELASGLEPIPTLLSLAVTLYRRDNISARRILERALAIEPNNVATLTLLGQICQLLRDLPNARIHLERSSAIDSSYPSSIDYLCEVLLEQGDLVNARTRIEQLFALQPRMACSHLSEVLRRQGNLVDARRRLEEALVTVPDNFYLLQTLTSVLEQQKAIEPNNASLRALLGDVLLRQHRITDARALLAEALAIDPHHVAALATLSRIPQVEKEFSESIARSLR